MFAELWVLLQLSLIPFLLRLVSMGHSRSAVNLEVSMWVSRCWQMWVLTYENLDWKLWHAVENDNIYYPASGWNVCICHWPFLPLSLTNSCFRRKKNYNCEFCTFLWPRERFAALQLMCSCNSSGAVAHKDTVTWRLCHTLWPGSHLQLGGCSSPGAGLPWQA